MATSDDTVPAMPVDESGRPGPVCPRLPSCLDVPGELTFADFEEMARLEARYYGDDYIAPADEAYAWYLRFPDTTVALVDRDGRPGRRIAGFVNLFPVRDAICEALRAGVFNDCNLTVDDIADAQGVLETWAAHPDGPAPVLHMFLSCIVVDGAYRAGGAASHALLREAVRRYEPVEHLADVVLTDNVTPEGVRFSQRWGFRPVCDSDHGSQVFEQPYADFARLVREGGPVRRHAADWASSGAAAQ